ncbi:putative trans-resveratrol di-O-methyltransferase [Helianthus anomalus]
MFEAIPKADALLLKWILHDCSDEKCVKILKQCKEAIPSKENRGKLIIIRHGREERSEQDWAKLFIDVGFIDYKVTPILGLRSLIEVYP